MSKIRKHRLKYVLGCLLLSLAFASCTSYRIEKRKYSSGYYISKTGRTDPSPVSASVNRTPHISKNNEGSTPALSSVLQIEETQLKKETVTVQQEHKTLSIVTFSLPALFHSKIMQAHSFKRSAKSGDAPDTRAGTMAFLTLITCAIFAIVFFAAASDLWMEIFLLSAILNGVASILFMGYSFSHSDTETTGSEVLRSGALVLLFIVLLTLIGSLAGA